MIPPVIRNLTPEQLSAFRSMSDHAMWKWLNLLDVEGWDVAVRVLDGMVAVQTVHVLPIHPP